MSLLTYFDGAQPGHKRKLTDEEKKQKLKDYEAKRVNRTFQTKWMTDRSWLHYEESSNKMFCDICKHDQMRCKSTNPFVVGCCNFRISAIIDHEKSIPHSHAVTAKKAKEMSPLEKTKSQAGNALKMLQASERHRLCFLFKNAHAIAKHNRPISDYKWLCEVDVAKGIDIGSTYLNDTAALSFIHSIANCQKRETEELLDKVPFFSFIMDGTTDISGSEQETIYLRIATNGDVQERFLNISSPKSTTSEDLYSHVIDVFQKSNLNQSKFSLK